MGLAVKFPFPLPPEGGAVLAVGENSLDFVAALSTEPVVAAKHVLNGFDRFVGGQAATAAVTCSRQGVDARYFGVFGDDEAGALVRAHLTGEGVEVVAIERPGARSRVAMILVDSTGERTVYEYRDSRLALEEPSVVTSAVAGAKALLVDATDIKVAIAAASAARAAGIPTVIDIDRVTPDAHRLLALIDVIVVPEPFLLAFTGAGTVGDGLVRIRKEFLPALVVATLGPAGSLALAAGREIRTPGFQVAAVDTTGAGDAFRGGLVSAWVRAGQDAQLEETLAAANATAALNCRAVGAQTALPARSDVEDLLTQTGVFRSN